MAKKLKYSVKKSLKIAAWAIPVLVILYVLYANFIASHTFNYFYDIGSDADVSRPFLTPLNRVSDASDGYRNLTSQLVYFDVPIARGSDRISVDVRFKNPYPEGRILLGGRDDVEWSYFSKHLYNPYLEDLGIDRMFFRVNPSMPEINSFSEIPAGAIIATDMDVPLVPNEFDFELSSLTVEHYLRDSHRFFVYVRDNFSLYIEKQDINWYEGEDIVNASLQTLDGKVLGYVVLDDDGVVDDSKEILDPVNGSLVVSDLDEGVYVLDISGNEDIIITKMILNTDRIVTNRIFTAESANYLSDYDRSVSFFVGSSRNSLINFRTLHSPYIQNINVGNILVRINQTHTTKTQRITAGAYNITIPKSNMIIDSPSLISFSEENYFEPFAYTVVPIDSEIADYIVSEYTSVRSDGDWMIGSVSFDLKDLYTINGKLSMMFNIPHLAESRNESNQFYFGIDWINITVEKDGLFR